MGDFYFLSPRPTTRGQIDELFSKHSDLLKSLYGRRIIRVEARQFLYHLNEHIGVAPRFDARRADIVHKPQGDAEQNGGVRVMSNHFVADNLAQRLLAALQTAKAFFDAWLSHLTTLTRVRRGGQS